MLQALDHFSYCSLYVFQVLFFFDVATGTRFSFLAVNTITLYSGSVLLVNLLLVSFIITNTEFNFNQLKVTYIKCVTQRPHRGHFQTEAVLCIVLVPAMIWGWGGESRAPAAAELLDGQGLQHMNGSARQLYIDHWGRSLAGQTEAPFAPPFPQ